MTDQQRVAGWITLTMQHRTGALLAADRLEYMVGPTGQLSVSWRSGPTATMVAETLLAAADPDMPAIRVRPAFDVLTEHLRVGEVAVLLSARAPDPDRQPLSPRHPAPDWSWPTPLRDIGAAVHTVHWSVPPIEDGDGVAVVGEVPPSLLRSDDWHEPGLLVAHADHDLPEHLDSARRRECQEWQRKATIRLRMAGFHDPISDADDWLRAQQPDAEFAPPTMAAVCWPGACLMTMRTHLIGLRIYAHLGGEYAHGPTPLVPAAVLSAVNYDPAFHAPARVRVRRYGKYWNARTFELETELITPRVTY